MTPAETSSMRCSLGRGLTVERRIATALWNHQERERIIAMRAHEGFCSRGCEHGFDLDDWLKAEQQLESEADDVVIRQSEAGLDISIAERAEQPRILLSIAPSSLLVLWTREDTNNGGEEPDVRRSTLRLTPLPQPADPERAEVTFRDGRMWLHLPCVQNGSQPQFTSIPQKKRARGAAGRE